MTTNQGSLDNWKPQYVLAKGVLLIGVQHRSLSKYPARERSREKKMLKDVVNKLEVLGFEGTKHDLDLTKIVDEETFEILAYDSCKGVKKFFDQGKDYATELHNVGMTPSSLGFFCCLNFLVRTMNSNGMTYSKEKDSVCKKIKNYCNVVGDRDPYKGVPFSRESFQSGVTRFAEKKGFDTACSRTELGEIVNALGAFNLYMSCMRDALIYQPEIERLIETGKKTGVILGSNHVPRLKSRIEEGSKSLVHWEEYKRVLPYLVRSEVENIDCTASRILI